MGGTVLLIAGNTKELQVITVCKILGVSNVCNLDKINDEFGELHGQDNRFSIKVTKLNLP